MQRVLWAVVVLAFAGAPAMAGPNAGGTLIVALSEGTAYSGDDAPYCWNTVASCDEAVTRIDDNGVIVLNVIAAFANAASPRLAGITFGIDYGIADPNSFLLVDWGPCGEFELPDGNWPAPGSGNAVTWGSAQTAQLVDVYWFAGYDYYGLTDSFCLIPNPTQGVDFADDDIPANLDPIADLGCFGFYQDGVLPCPLEDVPGACCYPDGACEILLEADCVGSDGIFDGTAGCEPNPCPQPPLGACCTPSNDCFLATEADCIGQGYDYVGDDIQCDPNPCGAIPTHKTTWGQIKANFGESR